MVVRVPFVGSEVGEDRNGDRGSIARVNAPWPGSVPPPSPTLLPIEMVPVDVVDEHGRSIRVSGRGTLSADPVAVRFDERSRGGVAILGWAGPWPSDERWWDTATRRRRARLQVALVDGRALLVQIERGRWSVEAIYD